jgi:transposase
MVLFIGADVHKRSHTLVAVDPAGRTVGQVRVLANEAGHEKAYRWAKRFKDQDRVWGVEDCRHLTGRLERDLLAHGEKVLRVKPKLMARQRAAARTYGKSDPIDALSVARALAREEDLPQACPTGPEHQLRLLLARREDLVAERTRAVNRLRWHLHELDPDLDPARGALNGPTARRQVREFLAGREGIVAEIAGMELDDVERACQLIAELTRRIEARAAELAPDLLEIPGCAGLTAAKIVAETAGIGRFPHPGKYVMFAGCAPIPVWSGNTEGKVRLNRRGNRQLNCAIHRIAVTQIRLEGPGQEYYRRLRARGKGKMEALRCLKTAIARNLWRTMNRAHAQTPDHPACRPIDTEATCLTQAA